MRPPVDSLHTRRDSLFSAAAHAASLPPPLAIASTGVTAGLGRRSGCRLTMKPKVPPRAALSISAASAQEAVVSACLAAAPPFARAVGMRRRDSLNACRSRPGEKVLVPAAAAVTSGRGDMAMEGGRAPEEEGGRGQETAVPLSKLASSGQHDELLEDLLRKRRRAEWEASGGGAGLGGEETATLSPCQDLGSAIFTAAAGGRVSTLECLLRYAGSSVLLARLADGLTALQAAARIGSPECIRVLLQHHPLEQVLAVDGRLRTALMDAIRFHHPGCVRALLGYWPEEQVLAGGSAEGHMGQWTPLMDACMVGGDEGAEYLELLLQYEPVKQVLAVDHKGQNALSVAIMRPFDKGLGCVHALLRYEPERQVAALFAPDRDASSLERQRDVFMSTPGGGTGNLGCFEAILKHCPQGDCPPSSELRKTAKECGVLGEAAQRGMHGLVRELLERWPTIRGKDGALQRSAREWQGYYLVSPMAAQTAIGTYSKPSPAGCEPEGDDNVRFPPGEQQLSRMSRMESLKRCMVLLLASGAMLPWGAKALEREAVGRLVGSAAAHCVAFGHPPFSGDMA